MQEWKLAHDRTVRCLGYLHAEANPDHSILWFWLLLRYTSEIWKKCGVLHFGGMHPTAHISRYLSMCWAFSSLPSFTGPTPGWAGFHKRTSVDNWRKQVFFAGKLLSASELWKELTALTPTRENQTLPSSFLDPPLPRDSDKLTVKSFPSHMAHRAAMISFNQTPAYTAKPWIWG